MQYREFFLVTCCIVLMGTLRSQIDLAAYDVDPEIKSILDEHSEEIFKKIKSVHATTMRHGVWQFDWLPGYYIKYGLSRITGMERVRTCIETHQLSLLTTPDKRVYHIKGRPLEASNLNYAIVVKEVEATKNPVPLTLEEVKQLCTIIHKTDYISMTSTNYIKMACGKICLIDTEGTFNADTRVKGFLRMIGTGHNLNTAYTKEALLYLFAELKRELAVHPHHKGFALAYFKQSLDYQKKPYAWDYYSFAYKNILKER